MLFYPLALAAVRGGCGGHTARRCVTSPAPGNTLTTTLPLVPELGTPDLPPSLFKYLPWTMMVTVAW